MSDEKVTVARMGHGVLSIADCFSDEVHEPGVIFMELPEPRPIGEDTSDIYPEGERARNVLAYVSFANAASIDQLVDVLTRIKAKYFGGSEC